MMGWFRKLFPLPEGDYTRDEKEVVRPESGSQPLAKIELTKTEDLPKASENIYQGTAIGYSASSSSSIALGKASTSMGYASPGIEGMTAEPTSVAVFPPAKIYTRCPDCLDPIHRDIVTDMLQCRRCQKELDYRSAIAEEGSFAQIWREHAKHFWLRGNEHE